MKILHVCESLTGGITTYVTLLHIATRTQVSNVFLVPGSQLKGLPSDAALRTYRAERRGVAGIVAMLGGLKTAIREEAPDIIFFHSTFTLIGMAVIRLMGWRGPVLYCAHGWAVDRYGNGRGVKARLVQLTEGWLSGLADIIVNISQYDHDLAKRLQYRGRHVLVENAVEAPDPNAREDMFAGERDGLHLLFVGRLDRQKGYDILLDAFALASAERDDLRLHIIGSSVRGDGGARATVPGVSHVGWVDRADLDNWYRSADALVVPSRWEGFGLVVPEALRNGTPVLCSDRGALPTLITPGSTGEIFPVDAGALAGLLRRLDKSALRQRRPLCRSAFEERFSLARWSRELEGVFEEAAMLRGSSRGRL